MGRRKERSSFHFFPPHLFVDYGLFDWYIYLLYMLTHMLGWVSVLVYVSCYDKKSIDWVTENNKHLYLTVLLIKEPKTNRCWVW